MLFRSPPSIAPAKQKERWDHHHCRNRVNIPAFGGQEGREHSGERQRKKKRDCIPREKVLGKRSSIPGDQVGKCYPGRSVSFGKEPGAQEPVPKEAAWKTLQLFYSKPPFGGHGAGAAGGERAPAA